MYSVQNPLQRVEIPNYLAILLQDGYHYYGLFLKPKIFLCLHQAFPQNTTPVHLQFFKQTAESFQLYTMKTEIISYLMLQSQNLPFVLLYLSNSPLEIYNFDLISQENPKDLRSLNHYLCSVIYDKQQQRYYPQIKFIKFDFSKNNVEDGVVLFSNESKRQNPDLINIAWIRSENLMDQFSFKLSGIFYNSQNGLAFLRCTPEILNELYGGLLNFDSLPENQQAKPKIEKAIHEKKSTLTVNAGEANYDQLKQYLEGAIQLKFGDTNKIMINSDKPISVPITSICPTFAISENKNKVMTQFFKGPLSLFTGPLFYADINLNAKNKIQPSDYYTNDGVKFPFLRFTGDKLTDISDKMMTFQQSFFGFLSQEKTKVKIYGISFVLTNIDQDCEKILEKIRDITQSCDKLRYLKIDIQGNVDLIIKKSFSTFVSIITKNSSLETIHISLRYKSLQLNTVPDFTSFLHSIQNLPILNEIHLAFPNLRSTNECNNLCGFFDKLYENFRLNSNSSSNPYIYFDFGGLGNTGEILQKSLFFIHPLTRFCHFAIKQKSPSGVQINIVPPIGNHLISNLIYMHVQPQGTYFYVNQEFFPNLGKIIEISKQLNVFSLILRDSLYCGENSEFDLNQFFNSIKKIENLKFFFLILNEKFVINNEGFTLLGEALSKNKKMREAILEVHGEGIITNDGFKGFFGSLKESPLKDLEKLKMSFAHNTNSITNEGFEAMFYGLKRSVHMKEFVMNFQNGHNSITDKGFRIIPKLLNGWSKTIVEFEMNFQEDKSIITDKSFFSGKYDKIIEKCNNMRRLCLCFQGMNKITSWKNFLSQCDLSPCLKCLIINFRSNFNVFDKSEFPRLASLINKTSHNFQLDIGYANTEIKLADYKNILTEVSKNLAGPGPQFKFNLISKNIVGMDEKTKKDLFKQYENQFKFIWEPRSQLTNNIYFD